MPLAPLTTLRVGPVARRVITCTTTEQVVAALRGLRDEGVDPLVLAGGSNVVIADRADRPDRGAAGQPRDHRSTATCCAPRPARCGTTWCRPRSAAGLGGLECLSGIPGSAGATPVQNVGAYGAEVADTITRVRLLDRRTGEVRWVPAAELGFGYRTSVLKHPPPGTPAPIVVEVEFALDASGRSAPLRYGELTTALGAEAGERADPARVRDAVLALRRRKGMVLDAADHDTWSVGSFFTNPVVRRNGSRGCGRRSTGPVPQLSGRRTASSWRRAGWWSGPGFGKGFPGDGAPARLSDQARAGADQPRHRHQRPTSSPWRRHGPRRSARRVRHPLGARTRAGRRCDLSRTI